MLDWILPLITSPWIYLIVFTATAVDAFFPPLPSGALVVTLGAFAVTGDPQFAGLLAAAASGAFVGDTISYLIGRHLTHPLRRASTGRARAAAGRIHDALAAWGGGMLIVARFVPGGRTLATISAGSLRYPIRRFWFFTAVAAVAWGSYTTAIGYLGGEMFDSALPGAVGGLLLASGLSLAVEAARRVAHRRVRPKRPLTRGGDHGVDVGASRVSRRERRQDTSTTPRRARTTSGDSVERP